MAGLSRRQIEISNALGLHLRAASQFVQLSRQFHAEVRVFYNGRVADGRSILDLMMLAAECGAPLELEVNGPEAEEATAALCALIDARFHEDEDGWDERPGS
jgi:phosphocarrier protein HPr